MDESFKQQSLRVTVFLILDSLFLPFFILLSIISRFLKKPIDVGLGPMPLINNVYHKKALIMYGYSAETFVDTIWHITKNFDVVAQDISKAH